ncbi:Putative protein [Zobellia galactanivorans]|uniref:Uncharacterized protein n=1 Tax=Zobellia galactanivorans (strain DSM 12802 / CCUG 47099 / CIP 106680 / NCIMB 13871 / Dsij) TaxID=63186 RepID=G0L8G5_ZOBGA|nr:Putative protein [Zobellia galactanivorans]
MHNHNVPHQGKCSCISIAASSKFKTITIGFLASYTDNSIKNEYKGMLENKDVAWDDLKESPNYFRHKRIGYFKTGFIWQILDNK